MYNHRKNNINEILNMCITNFHFFFLIIYRIHNILIHNSNISA